MVRVSDIILFFGSVFGLLLLSLALPDYVPYIQLFLVTFTLALIIKMAAD